MALDRYEGPAEVQFDNSTLAEATSLSITNTSNANPVTTMKGGLRGRSRGAPMANIQVDNAIPKAGMEVEFIEKCVQDADVTITHLFGDRRYIYDGWIDEVATTQGTDAPTSLSFTVTARPPRIV